MMTEYIPDILIMLVCILLSAFFSATETAFSSMNRTRLRVLADKGNKRADLACRLADSYDQMISTILIGNNIVNIALSSIAAVVFVSILGHIGATVSTVVITVLVLIFGEVTPKSIAKDNPESFAMFAAPFVNFCRKLFTPLNWLFSRWKKLISRIFKANPDSAMSQEELLKLLEEVEEDGGLDQDEGELLRNAVEFGDLQAKDILTHRVDLEAVSVHAPKEDIAAVFSKTRLSRLLVYEDSIDKIIGILHLKDFYQGNGVTEDSVREIMTVPVFSFQTEKVDDLLRRLQSRKSHVAVVLDEYGGTLGIVTMEDILEELVGEIWDEHDEVENDIVRENDHTYVVDCSMSLSEFCDRFDFECESESVSVGGWIMEQIGCIPRQGDQFHYDRLNITVDVVNAHRVETVTVRV